MIWEAELLQALQNIRTPFLDVLMKGATMLGEHGIVSILLGMLSSPLVAFFRNISVGLY